MSDEQMELSFDEKLKRHRKRKRISILTISVLLIFLVLYFTNTFLNKEYNTYKVVTKIPKKDSSLVNYMKYGNNYIKYTRDGIQALDRKGNVLWTGSYDMKEPKAEICGEYVAVADIGSKGLYVYDGKGNSAVVDILLPIIKVRIAKQGVIAVMMKKGRDANEIFIYNPFVKQDNLIYDIKTTTDKDGYPVDMDLSEDGLKLVTSYLYVNNGAAENRVSFLNFGEVGQNADGNLVGLMKFDQSMVPKVEFLSKDKVCVFAENGFTVYEMKQKPYKLFDIKVKTNIKSICYNDKYIILILENLKGKEKYQLKAYNTAGKSILEMNIDYNYDTVFLQNEELIFYNKSECTILRMNGSVKFHSTFKEPVSYILPGGFFNRYVIIHNTSMEEIKLKEADKT